jgi:hypothetical protein
MQQFSHTNNHRPSARWAVSFLAGCLGDKEKDQGENTDNDKDPDPYTCFKDTAYNGATVKANHRQGTEGNIAYILHGDKFI